MNNILTVPERSFDILNRRARWLPVSLLLVVTRLLLNIAALLGANWLPLAESIGKGDLSVDPRSLPGVWVRWDAGYYLGIARNGYAYHDEALGFFPAYPLLIRFFSAGQPALMIWAGFLIANLAFLLAGVLLWDQLRLDYSESIAWGTVITLSVFPTSLFFSAVYTESLFLLFSVLVYRCSMRRQYILAGICVSAASLTRINGLLLAVIPLIEIISQRAPQRWVRLIVTGLVASIGLGLYGGFLWMTQGSPVAFVLAQQEFMKRSITWPWLPIADSAAVIVYGYGGFENNWFMRAISVQDLLALVLFTVCTLLACRFLRRSLGAYAVAATLLLLISHGPYTLGVFAMSRYVLGVFPGFIVLAMLLDRMHRLRWGVWAVLLLLQVGLTIWFASGRWVA